MAERFDCTIVGGGVIGAAIARAIMLRFGSKASVLLLERGHLFGSVTSARSSEVIHAGIYYAPGSLKARYCVDGRQRLYRYMQERALPHQKIGKLIVAQDELEIRALESLAARGAANGVEGLRFLDSAEAMELEPHLRCKLALQSVETGIFDSHALVQSLIRDFEDAGGLAVLKTELQAGWIEHQGVRLETAGPESMQFTTGLLINAAGLHASRLSNKIEGIPPSVVPQPRWAKGSYFACNVRPPFSRLIYPAPEVGGLGTHLTFDLGNQARFGPDVEWVDEEDYSVDASRAKSFYDSVRRYWPGLPDDSLIPAYSGVRPKVAWGNEIAQDFIVQGPAQHAGANVIALYGIESPGFTSALAIADATVDLAEQCALVFGD